jgi:hypothetical protein
MIPLLRDEEEFEVSNYAARIATADPYFLVTKVI